MAFKTTRWTLANILPVAFVVQIILSLWLLYGFLHLLPLLQSADPGTHHRGVVQTAVSQSITFLVLVCFIRAIVTDPGSVPNTPEWAQGASASQQAQPLAAEVKQTGEPRFCKWCNQYKPDRCHHCRVCRSCILRMDHHCPWIANCVGFRNHKYFLLLVFYAMINTIFIIVTMMESMSRAVSEEMTPLHRFGIVYCMTLASLMSVLLVPFFLLHMSFMANGQTTIEFCEKRSKQGTAINYNMGLWKNAKNTLGSNVLLWLLPLSPPEGDGLHFESAAVAAAAASAAAAVSNPLLDGGKLPANSGIAGAKPPVDEGKAPAASGQKDPKAPVDGATLIAKGTDSSASENNPEVTGDQAARA